MIFIQCYYKSSTHLLYLLIKTCIKSFMVNTYLGMCTYLSYLRLILTLQSCKFSKCLFPILQIKQSSQRSYTLATLLEGAGSKFTKVSTKYFIKCFLVINGCEVGKENVIYSELNVQRRSFVVKKCVEPIGCCW